ncbi:MAG: NAD(P)-binding protein [Magnetospirillum sp.]|nr:NAD(P)-binding protein [Magnetospirillum sp.]
MQQDAVSSVTYRRYRDGDTEHPDWREHVFEADGFSYKCPTYVLRTPPCQGACPSGHDIRGWMNVIRGVEKPPAGMSWQEYVFRRMVDANPFPAIMGRVCPAPCQKGCNRNHLDEFVGINSIEQYVGDWALAHGMTFPKPDHETGKKVALIGGGPASLSAAYQLRRKGHSVTIFEEHELLGGMVRYGIPGYRTPRDVLDGEIARILGMGVEARCNTKVGRDITLAQIQAEFDAVFLGMGAQAGQPLDVPGAKGAPNCITGVQFLGAFNDGRLRHLTGRVLVIGGGDTAMDVAAVAKRLGTVEDAPPPEEAIFNQTTKDVATVASREGGDVAIVYRRPISKAPATKHEIEAVLKEGVAFIENRIPVEVMLGADGRACGLKVATVDWSSGKMVTVAGSEEILACDLIVAATGQWGDITGLEVYDNGKGALTITRTSQVSGHPTAFAGGDVIKPFLLTTAVGNGWVAAEGIDAVLRGDTPKVRPKTDGHHFDMLAKLDEAGLSPVAYGSEPTRGTDTAPFAVHNFDDRSQGSVVAGDELYLGHFPPVSRNVREEREITAENVLDNYEERFAGLGEHSVIAEAKRCMSCGQCFECDNCVIYCPQAAVTRLPKKERTVGRYVTTDYHKCVGCHICRDVCPTGYIQMGLGEG